MNQVPSADSASQSASSRTQAEQQQALQADDRMVGAIVGGILTLAFVVLLLAMLLVNLWTFSAVS